MTKEKLFIIGDIHGEYDLLEKLLKHWNEEEEQLVFLGDLIDRGPGVKKCLQLVKHLVDTKGAICVSGNHEDILLKWLAEPSENMDWYLRNGGKATIESLTHEGVLDGNEPTEVAQYIEANHTELIDFIKNLPLYYETDYCICVHAGINFDLDNWRDTSRRDFIWMREEFYRRKNTLPQLIVFGHTPVQSLHNHTGHTHIWYFQKKVCIDGGAVYQGALHALVVSKQGIEANYQILHPDHRFE